jgi:hypothetical protein
MRANGEGSGEGLREIGLIVAARSMGIRVAGRQPFRMSAGKVDARRRDDSHAGCFALK